MVALLQVLVNKCQTFDSLAANCSLSHSTAHGSHYYISCQKEQLQSTLFVNSFYFSFVDLLCVEFCMAPNSCNSVEISLYCMHPVVHHFEVLLFLFVNTANLN
jgi:hypothetical protein